MDPKPWWTSKTLYANVIAGIALLTGAFGLDLGLTPEEQAKAVAGIMVAVNIVLRFVTKGPIA